MSWSVLTRGCTRAIVGAVGLLASAAWAQSFRGIGTLNGFSEALGVATEGTAAGTSEDLNFDTRAVLSTPAGTLINLGTLGGSFSEGGDLSADGLVVVGGSQNAAGRQRAFRWTIADGMADLGTIGGLTAFATSTDAAGAVVSGWATNASAQMIAFRWTSTLGMESLGTLGGNRSVGLGVSGDGKVIVGFARNPSNATRAFRWTSGVGMMDLGTLGGNSSNAEAANSDGAVIVGDSTTASGNLRAFRWTQATGMIDLGILPGGFASTALDVSGNGSRIVGEAGDKSFNRVAVLWDGGGPAQDLNVLFASVIPDGWLLERATSISADGRYIAGMGTNPAGHPEGWVLDTVPAPASAAGLAAIGLALARRRRD